MEFKGTKEKWIADNDLIFAEDYFQTHIAVIPDTYNEEIKKANALLISKAPEMLQMLIELTSDNTWENTWNDKKKKAKQLIKEATEI